MSFFSKGGKSKKAPAKKVKQFVKSSSPSLGRKSAPAQFETDTSKLPSKSYSQSKSEDPDLSLGLSKSGGEDLPPELPKLTRQFSSLSPYDASDPDGEPVPAKPVKVKGATKSVPYASKATTQDNASSPIPKVKAKSAPYESKATAQNTASSPFPKLKTKSAPNPYASKLEKAVSSPVPQGESLELPPSYGQTQQDEFDNATPTPPPPPPPYIPSNEKQPSPSHNQDASSTPPAPPPLPKALSRKGKAYKPIEQDEIVVGTHNAPLKTPSTSVAKSTDEMATDIHFQTIAEYISPSELPKFCRQIGLTTTKVEQIQYDNKHLGFQEQVIAILQEWRKKAGREVTLKAVLVALKRSGNSQAANSIEDKLNIRLDDKKVSRRQPDLHPTQRLDGASQDKSGDISEESLRDRLGDNEFQTFERAMSELKKKTKDGNEEDQKSQTHDLKYFCPKCNQGYRTSTLLRLHVDECIEHVGTAGAHKYVSPESKKYTCPKCNKSYGRVNLLQLHVEECITDPNVKAKNESIGAIIDEQVDYDLVGKVASHLQEGDWQKLAYQLGYLPHAIERFEKRNTSDSLEQQAIKMLMDWKKRHKTRQKKLGGKEDRIIKLDLTYELSEALKNCKSDRLYNLGVTIMEDQGQTLKSMDKLKSVAECKSEQLDSPAISTLDSATMRQLSSQLGRDWPKLAHHLGYSHRAVQRLQSRREDYNSQEQALHMLTEWQRKQAPTTDVVGSICKALQKCGERHLAELGEWLRKQQSGKTAGAEGTDVVSSELQSTTVSSKGSGQSRGGSHIMISYQWDAQKQVIRLKEQLMKAGYNIWMDVDKMGGDLLGSMADAVENAAVIIICVSSRYKESINCRGEASYAFQLKKPIIPVIVEKGYKPDGWLGMVISMRLYYRIYNAQVLQEDLPSLINDLGDKGRTYQHQQSFTGKASASSIDSYDLNKTCKAHVYLCDLHSEQLPYADIWVTLFLKPDLKIFKDKISELFLNTGGEELRKNIAALKGITRTPVKVGTVLDTPPGGLPCQIVFHVVFRENVQSSGYAKELDAAFTECVKLANIRNSTSIAFSLFTNQQAFEYATVVEQAVVAVMDNVVKSSQGNLKRVLFVSNSTALVKKASNELHHSLSLLTSVPTMHCKYPLKNGRMVTVKEGNMKIVSTDAIVVSISKRYERIGLCAAIYVAGGPAMQEEFNKYTKKHTHKPGDAFKIGSGRLPCGKVIYAVVPTASITNKSERESLMEKSVLSSFKIADKDKCVSIAVPMIGANYGHFMPDEIADILVGAVMKYFQKHPSSNIKEVQFIDRNSSACKRLQTSLTERYGLTDIREGTDIQEEESTDGAEAGATGDDTMQQEIGIDIEETPAEILARGPEAQQAYLEASQEGTKPVYRTRLMLVGQERVGKTSLMKNLSGQRFDATEIITDGVDATTLCEVPVDSGGKPWNLQNSAIADLANHVQSQYVEAICTVMAQRLTDMSQTQQNDDMYEDEIVQMVMDMKDFKLIADEPQAPQGPPDADGAPSGEEEDDLCVDSAPMSEEEGDDAPKEDEELETDAMAIAEPEVTEAKVPAVPDAILQKLRQVLREMKQELKDADTKKAVQEFQVWDFAGQDVYYTTHQVFLSNRAIYMVIFDLRLDLNKPVKVEVFHHDKVQSRFHDFSGLGFLNFWMQSIYAYATTNQFTTDEGRPQLSPPIFIIGTHRDSPDISPDPEERKILVSEKFQTVSEMIAGKPYEQHVVSRYYAIENSSNDQEDAELTAMRQHIASITSQEPYMGEKIPLRWLTFEQYVAEAITKGQHYMNLNQVRELTQGLGIKDENQLFTMLQFYHDLGTIIYFGGGDNSNAYLQDMVILNPQWLIDIFKRIVTVMPHQKQWPTLKTKWRRLKEEGILEDHLIDHMWKDLLPQKPALLALMEMFDLLCPRMDANEDCESYYVPACLQPCTDEEVKQELEAGGKPVNFYVDFQGFLPDGLFHRLLVHAARWSQQQSGEEPTLYYRYGSFYLDDEHSFQLEMQTSTPICIKVSVCKMLVMSPDGLGDNSNVEMDPCPKACSTVRSFLEHTLNELTFTWIRGIKYSFAVACLCSMKSQPSETSKCLHLLSLKDCMNKKSIKCKGMKITTKLFQKWFHVQVQDDVEQIKRANRSMSDVELFELAGEVGIHWKKLGLYLGLRASNISSLDHDHPMTEDKAFHTLIQWHEGVSKTADQRGLLAKALKKCGLVGLAESYTSPKDVQ